MKELKNALLIFAVAFVLNLVWEKSHMVLYDIAAIPMDPWWILLRATFWDAVMITGVYLFVDTPNKTKRYFLSAIVCVVMAVFIEQRAMAEGRWEYLPTMPIVLGMGLSPLIQLPLLALITFEIVRKMQKTVNLVKK